MQSIQVETFNIVAKPPEHFIFLISPSSFPLSSLSSLISSTIPPLCGWFNVFNGANAVSFCSLWGRGLLVHPPHPTAIHCSCTFSQGMPLVWGKKSFLLYGTFRPHTHAQTKTLCLYCEHSLPLLNRLKEWSPALDISHQLQTKV